MEPSSMAAEVIAAESGLLFPFQENSSGAEYLLNTSVTGVTGGSGKRGGEVTFLLFVLTGFLRLISPLAKTSGWLWLRQPDLTVPQHCCASEPIQDVSDPCHCPRAAMFMWQHPCICGLPSYWILATAVPPQEIPCLPSKELQILGTLNADRSTTFEFISTRNSPITGWVNDTIPWY